MNDTLKTIKEMEGPQLLLAFVVLSGLIAPGAAAIWVFDPAFVYEKDVSKLVFLSFVLTAPPALLNFVVISVFGFMRGHPRNTPRLSTEFTFSVLAIVASYSSIVFVSIVCKLTIIVFSVSSLLLNIFLVALIVALMDKPESKTPNKLSEPTP